jgi:hypothetical protein
MMATTHALIGGIAALATGGVIIRPVSSFYTLAIATSSEADHPRFIDAGLRFGCRLPERCCSHSSQPSNCS